MTTPSAPKPAPKDMTLRDWFAGQATNKDIDEYIPSTIGEMCELFHHLGFGPKPENQECIRYMSRYPVSKKLRAWAKYQYADAMLAERSKTEGA